MGLLTMARAMLFRLNGLDSLECSSSIHHDIDSSMLLQWEPMGSNMRLDALVDSMKLRSIWHHDASQVLACSCHRTNCMLVNFFSDPMTVIV